MKIELSKDAAKLYRRVWSSNQDLLAAKAYADHLLKKNWFEPPWTRRQKVFFQQHAFTTALVVSYARAFLDPKEWEAKVLSLVPDLSQEEIELHRNIMKMRNQIFAHSDLRTIDVVPAKFSDDDLGEIPGVLIGARTEALTRDQIQTLTGYIDELASQLYLQSLMLAAGKQWSGAIGPGRS